MRAICDNVWPRHPVLSVYAGGEVDLEKLEFPKDLIVVSVNAVKTRTREGLKSTDKTVRGWGCGELAALDPYDDISRKAISLKRSKPWFGV